MTQDPAPSTSWRKIRSFVLRPGRLTSAQQAALDVLLPKYAFCPNAWPKASRVVLEIGFGNGQALAEMARLEPDAHLIGVEVHPPGVGRLLNTLEREGIANVSVAMTDAVELLERDLPKHQLDEVRIYFPDPWPKKKHHKRRLIQTEFMNLLSQTLRVGGRLHLATDWMPYAEWMEEVIDPDPRFRRILEATHQRPSTHFQRRGERRGHPVVDLIYEHQLASETPESSTQMPGGAIA